MMAENADAGRTGDPPVLARTVKEAREFFIQSIMEQADITGCALYGTEMRYLSEARSVQEPSVAAYPGNLSTRELKDLQRLVDLLVDANNRRIADEGKASLRPVNVGRQYLVAYELLCKEDTPLSRLVRYSFGGDTAVVAGHRGGLSVGRKPSVQVPINIRGAHVVAVVAYLFAAVAIEYHFRGILLRPWIQAVVAYLFASTAIGLNVCRPVRQRMGRLAILIGLQFGIAGLALAVCWKTGVAFPDVGKAGTSVLVGGGIALGFVVVTHVLFVWMTNRPGLVGGGPDRDNEGTVG